MTAVMPTPTTMRARAFARRMWAVVKAARLVDGRGGPPLVPAMVRVEGDRIAAVATLLAGFTTCRDMGPTWPYVDVDLRGAIAEGAASRCYRPEAVFSNSFLYSP